MGFTRETILAIDTPIHLNAQAPMLDPTQRSIQERKLFFYIQLSGLDANQQPVANMKSYFAFKPKMLGHPAGNTITVPTFEIRLETATAIQPPTK